MLRIFILKFILKKYVKMSLNYCLKKRRREIHSQLIIKEYLNVSLQNISQNEFI